ncbi:MAG: DegQ family serine endoprotease [Burkholderiaceae bacterium]
MNRLIALVEQSWVRRFGVAAATGLLTLSLTVGLTLGSALAPHPAAAQSAANRGLPDFTGLIEKAGPAVVNIRTLSRESERGSQGMPFDENDPFFEFFKRFGPPGNPGFGPRQGPKEQEPSEPRPRGVGSGFIISQDGYLLSNHHVVEGADEVLVTLTDKREFKAKIIGSDQRTDVALLKIEAKGLPTLTFGNPDQIKVGEWVLAIGSPFGLENTVTAGIVSAKGRDTGDYLPFIQTDVAVNPGNSGGPLLNLNGEVIGINSQIYSRTGGFMGISFAIPIDEAKRVADQLRANGRVIRGRIGVAIDEVNKDVADALGLPSAKGALVRNVEAGGPAAKAGVEPGDIVLGFAGKPVNRVSDLPRLVGNTKPGSQAELKVWRRGSETTLKVTVDEIKPEPTATAAAASPKSGPSASVDWLGLAVADLTEAQRNELKIKAGVRVVGAKGPAERAGLRQGDIILSVNNAQVSSAGQLQSLIGRLDRKKTVVMLVRRGDGVLFIPVKP